MVNAIILDDEPLAIDVIKKYIENSNDIFLLDSFSSPIQALKFINENKKKIDLIFLDIQMPELDGIEFMELIPENSAVILTTAYSNYAIESYKFNVIDYLLKPFSFSKFRKAIDKYHNISKNETHLDYIFINNSGSFLKIKFDDIILIKGNGDYIDFITEKKKYLVRENLTKVSEMLPKSMFFRIHRSYIVNINYVDEIHSNHLKIKSFEISISKTYKDDLISFVSDNKFG